MKEQKKISIADIVSSVGLVALLLFTFLGAYFKKGGEISMPIVLSAIVFALTFLLCSLAKKFKQEEVSSKSGWLYWEITMLVLYVVCALFSSKYSLHFFSVNSDREEMKKVCKMDCDSINAFIDRYVAAAEGAKEKVKNKLANPSTEWRTWAKDHGVALNKNSIETYVNETLQKELLDDTEYARKSWKEEVDGASAYVDKWSWLYVPGAAKKLKDVGEDAPRWLADKFKQIKMPGLSLDDSAIGSGLYSSIKGSKNTTLAGILLTVLIHFLVLFSYLVSPRPGSVRIKRRYNSDGAIFLENNLDNEETK